MSRLGGGLLGLYQSVGQLWASFPDLRERPLSPPTKEWIGRAYATVKASGDMVETAAMKLAMDGLLAHGDSILAYDKQIEAILLRVLYTAELALPATAVGTFIPVGSQYDAVLAMGKILTTATKDVLIVDPYMDRNTLDQYAVLAPEKVLIRLLADAKAVKADLKPTITAWRTQFAQNRPLEARCQRRSDSAAAGRSKSAAVMRKQEGPLEGAFLLAVGYS